jgi:hypothetical protein
LTQQVDLRQIDELADPPVEHGFEHEHAKLVRLLEGDRWRHHQLLTSTDDIEQRGAIVPKHLLHRDVPVLRRLDAHAFDAHGLGHVGEVRVLEIAADIEKAGGLHLELHESQDGSNQMSPLAPKLIRTTGVAGDLATAKTLPPLFAGGPNLFLLSGNGENATDLQRHALAAGTRFRLTPRIRGSMIPLSAIRGDP